MYYLSFKLQILILDLINQTSFYELQSTTSWDQ